MNKIDEIFTKRPYYGVPRITKELNKDIFMANHKRVYRLMGIMGIEAVFPKPNLSKPNIAHDIYPYLLTDLEVSHPNHVWGVDITYIRLRGDWLYLFVVLDWFSRYILSWELSDSLSSDFCCETLRRALTIAVPDIHNSDQGSQFTARDYLETLQQHSAIQISMDGRGRCFDNIFNERLWRSVKYEEVYLKDYQSFEEALASLDKYFKFYNTIRLHSSIDDQTPEQVYFQRSKSISSNH